MADKRQLAKSQAEQEISIPQTESRARYFMKHALYWAKQAASKSEIPIGCVIVKDGCIIAHGYNRREQKQDVTEHAEIMAIRSACRRLQSWRLDSCSIYVTLEPCFMCAGAIQQARIAKLYFAASDPKTGAVVSQANFFAEHPFNHRIEWQGGLLAEESSALLRQFFAELRKNDKRVDQDLGGRGKRRDRNKALGHEPSAQSDQSSQSEQSEQSDQSEQSNQSNK